MAQTFHANSATRLHPVEWSSGVAAGAVAALMLQLGMPATTTRALYEQHLDSVLQACAKAGPVEWTF